MRRYEYEELKEKFWGTGAFNSCSNLWVENQFHAMLVCSIFIRLSTEERARYFREKVNLLEYIRLEIERKNRWTTKKTSISNKVEISSAYIHSEFWII